jgi:redox-sensitive bicupin YhaK (pirin superfamily)
MKMSERKQDVYGSAGSHWAGDGFPVRTLIPTSGAADLDLFLMLDYGGPAHFEPAKRPRGVEQHPRRGFETVTIAYQGTADHRDSAGNSGTIQAGDVQWMTAASGVLHEEKHGNEFTERGGDFIKVQLWVNLPAAYNMSKPRYQAIVNDSIPTVQLGSGAFARIITGDLQGTRGPAQTFMPVNVYDVRMQAAGRGELSVPVDHNAVVVLLRGDIAINGTTLRDAAQMALLSAAGEMLVLEAAADPLLLILTGKPIHEPVVSYGPFVFTPRRKSNKPSTITEPADSAA